MPCYHPVPGWFARRKNASGKRSVVFNLQDGYRDMQVVVPCGRCIGCRLEKSRQWATRCLHESKLWDKNCFVTLTYDNEHVPKNGSLRPRDFVLFMKRLRKSFDDKVRFFHCGEYGEELGRPHHHALLFNCDFDDKRFYSGSGEETLYWSRMLDKLWGQGRTAVGSVTFESAGYVARYALKKITGPNAEAHYGGRIPEYLTMSRKPGIGSGYYDKYANDWYPRDECVVRGVACKPPRFYDKRLEVESPRVYRKVLRIRKERAEERLAKIAYPIHQLMVDETVKMAQISNISRKLEAM